MDKKTRQAGALLAAQRKNKRGGRKPTCNCLTCKKCKDRLYRRALRAKCKCLGAGWLLQAANNRCEIIRCDECNRYATDKEVRALPAAQECLREALRGNWSV